MKVYEYTLHKSNTEVTIKEAIQNRNLGIFFDSLMNE